MSEQFGDDFISITDEEGNDYELEVLGRVDYEGSEYLIVTLADADELEESLEVSVLKVVVDDGEEFLDSVEDDDEAEAVYALFMDENDDFTFDE